MILALADDDVLNELFCAAPIAGEARRIIELAGDLSRAAVNVTESTSPLSAPAIKAMRSSTSSLAVEMLTGSTGSDAAASAGTDVAEAAVGWNSAVSSLSVAAADTPTRQPGDISNSLPDSACPPCMESRRSTAASMDLESWTGLPGVPIETAPAAEGDPLLPGPSFELLWSIPKFLAEPLHPPAAMDPATMPPLEASVPTDMPAGDLANKSAEWPADGEAVGGAQQLETARATTPWYAALML